MLCASTRPMNATKPTTTLKYAIAAADVIEQRLNDALPDGIVAHWFDGEFFLSRTCAAAGTDEPCDDLECFCQCG